MSDEGAAVRCGPAISNCDQPDEYEDGGPNATVVVGPLPDPQAAMRTGRLTAAAARRPLAVFARLFTLALMPSK
ncbi:MAG TPA: hypothetical protein VGP46_09125 [Acidimicrobiales bacterium]|jgi:hypothetical protein|nr:hypothetical protein [Acidimicrobiales bacterium]